MFSGTCCLLLALFDHIYSRYLELHDHRDIDEVQKTEEKVSCRKKALTAFKSFSQSLRLPFFFWALTVVMLGYYASVLPLISYSNSFIIEKYGFSTTSAATVSSLLYGVATVFLLPVGFMIDWLGHRLSIIISGMLLVIIAYILFLVDGVIPWIPASILGLSFALVPAAVWPSYALIVDESKLGMAYGLSSALFNAVLFLVPLIAGYIDSYFYKNMMLMCIAILGFLLSIVLIILDRVLLKAKLELTCVKTETSSLSKRQWRILGALKKILKKKEIGTKSKNIHELLESNGEAQELPEEHRHSTDKE